LLKKEIINQDTNVVKYPFPGEPQLRMGEKEFRFDYVFNEVSKQTEVYTEAVKPLVNSFLKGYNTTIFAYGQTGSGKTYSMGTHGSDDRRLQEEWGIIPTSIQDICGQLEKMEHHASLTASFVEIYKEEVRDLLGTSHTPEKISIVEEENGEIGMRGCEMAEVHCYEDLMELLDKGASQRQTGETSMNSMSSRSHAIFTLYLQQVRESAVHEEGKAPGVDGEGEVVTSKFHFVDLAGSERTKLANTKGNRFKEGVAINSGLLALGNVIACLSQTVKARHVPFRDSKITRILQDSLGGNSLTIMIACLSPAASNIGQSINTLNYANRAKMIKNKPVVNVDARSKEIVALRDKIKALEARLRGDDAGEIDDGLYSSRSSANAPKLMVENSRLRDHLETAEESLKISQEKLKELRKDFSDKQDLVYENIAKSKELEIRCEKMFAKLQSLDSSICSEDFTLSNDEIEKARKAVDLERENSDLKSKVKELRSILAKDQFALAHLQRMVERFNEGDVEAFDQELLNNETTYFSPAKSDEFKEEGKAEDEIRIPSPAEDENQDEEGSTEDTCEITEHNLLETLEEEASKTEQSFEQAKEDMVKREKENKINSEVISRDISRTNRQILRLQEIMRAFSQNHQMKIQRSKQNEAKMRQLELDLQLAEESRRKLESQKSGSNRDSTLKHKLEQSNNRIKKLKETLKAAKIELRVEKKALAKQLKQTRHLKNLRYEMGTLKRKKVSLQKQLKADNKAFANWKTKHQQLVNQLNKKVRLKSIVVRQTKTKIDNIKRTLKEKTERNASLTRQLREVRKENKRRNTKSTPHLKRQIHILAQKLKDRDKVVRKMLLFKAESKTLQSDFASTNKEARRIRLILQGWMAVPEVDRDITHIQRLEQDQLRVQDQISEIDAQIVQNANALKECDRKLNMLTRPNSYRKILNNLDFLLKDIKNPLLLSKKMFEVTRCTVHDIRDVSAALPSDGARVAVILSNMLLAAYRDIDVEEKKRGEAEAEMLDMMSENQRLNRDRKNWEERYRTEILTKSALEVEGHFSHNEEYTFPANHGKWVNNSHPQGERSCQESLSVSPNSEAVLTFPDNCHDLQDGESSSTESGNAEMVKDPESSPVAKLVAPDHTTMVIDEGQRSSMDIWGSTKVKKVSSHQREAAKKLQIIEPNKTELYEPPCMSVRSSPRKWNEGRRLDEKVKRRVSLPSSMPLHLASKSCFDRLASPSGWTGTHKVTACQLPMNQARVRVKKKLEANAKKRKAGKAIHVLKRRRSRTRKEIVEMRSPPKKTFRGCDDKNKQTLDSDGVWSRLHSTKIGHAKHSPNC